MFVKLVITVLFSITIRRVMGHGMMLEPPNRSSLWRFYENATKNYNDNQNFCGGRAVQWDVFNGKCGVCGDRYDDPHPQDNENTGLYGQGFVPRTYKSGGKIDITIEITSNHLGHFKYSLCVLEDPNKPEPGEECFRSLVLGDGSTQYNVSSSDELVHHSLVLPYGLKCDRCVLRWDWICGNSWGQCDDGSYADGCGPQETFRSCADITIV